MLTVKASRSLLGREVLLTGKKGDIYFEHLATSPGLFEPDIVRLLAVSLHEKSITLDVGANIGYITLVMSMLAKGGRVYAFEPAKESFELLKENVNDNKLKNVTTKQIGLSDVQAKAVITYAVDNLSGGFVSDTFTQSIGGHKSSSIRLEKLDDLYKNLGIKKCDLIKVDIEGHELQFLEGAKGFIGKFKPLAIIEANHWCLNVFNRTSLPDFIDKLYKHFPHIFAFEDERFFDLSDNNARYRFLYENTVNNRFTNLYCGFDHNQLMANLCAGFAVSASAADPKNDFALLQYEKEQLQIRLNNLENAKLYRLIRKVQRIKPPKQGAK